MIRLFKKRSFTHGTLIEIRMADSDDTELIIEILDLISREHLFSMGPKVSTPGYYAAFHTTEATRIIKRHINKWTKNKKDEIKKKKWRS